MDKDNFFSRVHQEEPQQISSKENYFTEWGEA